MTLKKCLVFILGVCLSSSAYAQKKNVVKGVADALATKPAVLSNTLTRKVTAQVSAAKAAPHLRVKALLDYTYHPQDTNLATLQNYMQQHQNHWPQIMPLSGNVEAARSLYLAVIKDHQGLLSPADREQLYQLFLNNNIYSAQSIIRAYQRWKYANNQTDLTMPTQADLEMDASNPRFRAWYPQLFDSMTHYLQLPWKWNTATLIYLGQQVYPQELPAELLEIDVFRQNP